MVMSFRVRSRRLSRRTPTVTASISATTHTTTIGLHHSKGHYLSLCAHHSSSAVPKVREFLAFSASSARAANCSCWATSSGDCQVPVAICESIFLNHAHASDFVLKVVGAEIRFGAPFFFLLTKGCWYRARYLPLVSLSTVPMSPRLATQHLSCSSLDVVRTWYQT